MPKGLTKDEQVHLAMQFEHGCLDSEMKLDAHRVDALEFEFSEPKVIDD